VVRLIAQVIEAAHRRGKPVGMCGGMAGEPLAAPLLLGLGLDEWSMEAGALRRIKLLLHRLDASECRALAARVLALGTAAEVRAALEEFLQAAEG
jgi:Phosphoenolpyruvate-protein kinase (PTS system EI component in bacteria)